MFSIIFFRAHLINLLSHFNLKMRKCIKLWELLKVKFIENILQLHKKRTSVLSRLIEFPTCKLILRPFLCLNKNPE